MELTSGSKDDDVVLAAMIFDGRHIGFKDGQEYEVRGQLIKG
jgi:hypothetical protein